MGREQYQSYADKYLDEIVTTASEMIQRPSVSGNEKEMAEYTAAKMKELGYDDVHVDRVGNVIGLMRGTGGGKSVTLNCHMDVVDAGPPEKWKYPPYGGTIAEGAVWGRGASDTKATFAIQVYTPYILKKEGMLPKGDICVVGVVHEESSGFGAMNMAADGYFTDYCIIGEATENDICVACRGRMGIEVEITGKSCHASLPHIGANPFGFLGKFLEGLKDYKLQSHPQYGSSLITPTRIHSSEKGTNVIPNTIFLSLDYRSLAGETYESVIGQLNEIAASCAVDGVTVEIKPAVIPITCYNGATGEGYMGEPAFAIDENSETVRLAKKTLEDLFGRPVATKPWGFATDSGHFSQKGVQVIGYSPAQIVKCHTVEDSVPLDMIKEGISGTLALTCAFANN
ncbi:MAG: M20/M25/M40 family metallo-hydrolase [Defluviitaleaceae bacterium]|nr:M20/M25/M40 family metallo-hydrolase [Defluviitaleaceae bacterium]